MVSSLSFLLRDTNMLLYERSDSYAYKNRMVLWQLHVSRIWSFMQDISSDALCTWVIVVHKKTECNPTKKN